jgi:cytochrome c oxidase subunit 2
LLTGLMLVGACRTDQSALHPASENSREIARLFWVMTVGGALIWAAVIGVAVYAVLGRRKPSSERFADRFIFAGGVIFPTVVLAALLIYGLRLLPDWRAEAAPDLRVSVTGEQFWWRIAYELPDGRSIETANELHLPVGRVVEFELTAHDVIHSFWIPPLGGKLDLLPGRRNLLRLTPSQTGRFRGVCAEFCGASHALMAFPVIVHEPAEFDAWLVAEAAPADPAVDASAFRTAGCGACHRVRGLVAEGAVGPDLTHLARRETLAAGTLPMTEAALSAWLADPQAIKPDARMPAFGHLSEDERGAIVAFLAVLR